MQLSIFNRKVILSKRKVNLYLAHLLVFLIPFEQGIVPIGLVAFLVTNLFVHKWEERVELFKKRWQFIALFSSFYLLHAFGLLYSDNLGFGFFDLEVKLSMLLVPLVVLSSNVINRFTIIEILKTFIFGASISALYCFLNATFEFLRTEDYHVFYYKYLSYYHHPGYYAMYLNFAISGLLILIFHSKDKVRAIYFVLLSFLMVSVYQLSSRTGIMFLVLAICYAFVYLIFPKIRWKKSLIALFITILLTVSFAYKSSYVASRFSSGSEAIATENKTSSLGVRLSMWKYSMDIVKEHPILGVGTGDVKDELKAKYVEKGLTRAIKNNYNAHNQFVQSLVALGGVGLLSLLLSLVVPLFFSLKKRNFLYPLFVVNLSINLMTESVLETQSGVVFYAVFNTFLFFTYKEV